MNKFGYTLVLCITLLGGYTAVGQTESGSPIDLPTPTGIEPSNNNARMPLSLPKNLNLPKAEPMPMEFKVTRNPVKMIDDRNLVPAGAYLNLDPKIKSKPNKKSTSYYGDTFLGEVKTSDSFVGIVCRVHQMIDWDRVRIYLNGNLMYDNFYLTGGFKGINMDLAMGINKIEFEAINEGSASPNTAMVGVFNEAGRLIKQAIWNLSQGAKGTIIVVRE